MSRPTSLHIGISRSFAKELSEQPKQLRGSIVEKRLDVIEADLSKVDRFGIVAGYSKLPIADLERRPEVEWVEAVRRQFAI